MDSIGLKQVQYRTRTSSNGKLKMGGGGCVTHLRSEPVGVCGYSKSFLWVLWVCVCVEVVVDSGRFLVIVIP